MSKKKAYVIGTNVSKSLSPTIFNYWLSKYRIEAEYGYKEITEENFDREIKSTLEEDGLCGLNITIPFKEKIIQHLDILDKHSAQIGAVNCVSKIDKTLNGANTDWLGFQESLNWAQEHRTAKIEKKDTAIVIGYGGSAKAIIYSLSFMGFKTIRVFNRSFNKIKNINNITPHKLEELKDYFGEADLIVNTVPKNFEKELRLGLPRYTIVDSLNATGHGFDAVYNYNTLFLGHISYPKRIYGIHMLIHQAAPCFHKWFGIKPEVDIPLVLLLENKNISVLEGKK
jgi:shikimate dehydrogenase